MLGVPFEDLEFLTQQNAYVSRPRSNLRSNVETEVA